MLINILVTKTQKKIQYLYNVMSKIHVANTVVIDDILDDFVFPVAEVSASFTPLRGCPCGGPTCASFSCLFLRL